MHCRLACKINCISQRRWFHNSHIWWIQDIVVAITNLKKYFYFSEFPDTLRRSYGWQVLLNSVSLCGHGTNNEEISKECCYLIPWICYERSFGEFYLSIWNQLVFNQRLQLFVQSLQPYLLILSEEAKCVFPTYWPKNKWIYEFRRTNDQELKCWSTFCVNHLLRYYLMM